MLNNTQWIEAQKSALNAVIGATTQAFEGVQKLAELNLQTVRTSLNEASATALAALEAKDAAALLAVQTSLLQPAAEKAAAYGRHVANIASATGAEVGKFAEVQVAAAQKNVGAALDAALKSAPAGSESAVALVKSAVDATNNAVESVTKAAKQAADVAQSNLQAVSDTVAKASKRA